MVYFIFTVQKYAKVKNADIKSIQTYAKNVQTWFWTFLKVKKTFLMSTYAN